MRHPLLVSRAVASLLAVGASLAPATALPLERPYREPSPGLLSRLGHQAHRQLRHLLAREGVRRNRTLGRAGPLAVSRRRSLRYQAAPTLALRHLDLSLDPNLTTGVLIGRAVATLANENPGAVEAQTFYHPAYLTIDSVRRGEIALAIAATQVPEEPSLVELAVDYGTPVGPGETVVLTFSYQGTIRCQAESTLQIVDCVLSPTYTVLSGLQPAPYFDNDSSYDLHLAYPANLQVAVGAFPTGEETLPDGRKLGHWHNDHFSSLLVLGIGEFEVTRQIYGDLSVGSFTRPVDGPYRAAYHPIIRDIIEHYSATYYPYAFPKLDYIGVPDDLGFGGMAGSSLLLMADYSFATNPEDDPTLDQTFAHEIGHQWFAYMFPSFDWQAPWLSEGVTQYLSFLYGGRKLSRLYERDLDTYFFRFYNDYYLYAVEPARDEALTSRVYGDPSLDPDLYVLVVYIKGPLVTNALAQIMGGPEAFARAVHGMGERHLFEPFDTEAFRSFLEEGGGPSLEDAFGRWVYQRGYPTYTVRVKNETAPQGGKVTVRVSRSEAYPGVNEVVVSTAAETATQKVRFAGSELSAEIEVELAAPLRGVAFDPKVKQLRRVVMDPAGDLNGNGEVDGLDLLLLAWAQGSSLDDYLRSETSQWAIEADLNFDGVVGEDDWSQALDRFAEPNR